MAGGASIVVDIKAQITGYQEQIEKIKSELRKVDPGSSIGKSLNKALIQAEQKLTQLSRNAEKRITSQGQLEHLFDELHAVNDLMRNLGQGMTNVGMEDVLETASEKARELGQSLREVKTEMTTKGNSFFEELKKTNPKELQAVFDQLKFDPKTMGIDTFVEKFKEATSQAKEEVKNLSDKQKEAQAELQRTQAMKEAHDKLPIALQGTKVTQAAIRNAFGTGNNGLDAAKMVSERDAAAQEFIDKIRTALESDTSRSDENKANLSASLETTLTQLQEAKTKEQIESILQDLDKALKSTKGEGHGGSYRGITGMSGEIFNSALIEKLSQSTYQADQSFVDQVQKLVDLLSTSSSAEAKGAGSQIQTILNSLLQPTDISTFKVNMDALIREIQAGLQKMNQVASDFDVGTKESVVKQATAALDVAKGQAASLEKVSSSQAYDKLMTEYTGLVERMQRIEEMLGLEKTNNRASVAAGVNQAGQQALLSVPKMNQDATNSLKQYSSVLEDVQARQQMVGRVEGIAQRWFSVYAAVRMVTKAFRSMTQNVKALDKTMTEIAIVTDMSQSDLWQQMPTYTAMARKYGATLQGVYEVSQLYYQQGLEQDDVMALTEQTLKMARISGLDYGEATNYMTNAIRSFKIEMQDAQRVVDVYSALAASSASSTTELATAMSKTASSAAAVGSSFEATSAMMAVMIETTRESPENIGSALKSIISRYGELKENKTGIDEEGEAYSLNKVDTALQSVGISIHDAQGQFRDFDEVIMELAEHWDTIDTNTQRYIATVMAGNRQQSRFLALVSNGERLAELNETAADSEDASTLQVLKTMDSIDYKSQQLQTTLQSLYTSTGVENLFKGILDGANQIVETFTQMPTLFQLPIPALMSLATNFISVANIVMTTLRALKQKFMAQWELGEAELTAKAKLYGDKRVEDVKEEETKKVAVTQQGVTERSKAEQGRVHMKTSSKIALGAQLAGVGMSLASGLISDKGTGNRFAKAGLGIGGSALTYGALAFQMGGGLKGALLGGAIGALMGAWQNLSYIWESSAEQAKRMKKEAEDAQIEYKQKGAQTRSTEKELKNVKELAKAQNDSAEAREKYIEASNKLGADMPALVSYYDSEGNAVLDLSNAYELLAEKRREANEAANESANASIEAAKKNTEAQQENLKNTFNTTMTGGINYSQLKGQSATDWQWILKNASNVKDERGQFSIYNDLKKINDQNQGLDELAKIAQKNVDETTPYVSTMLSQLQSISGREALGNDLLTQRDTMLSYWRDEMTHITDPLTSQMVNFIINQLESGVADLVDASGQLTGAKVAEKSIISSQMADYVNRYREAQNDIVNFSTDQSKIKEAQKNLDLFKDLNNASEIITNYLTQQFIDSGMTWDEFEQDTENGLTKARDTIIGLLQQIPTTALDSINTLFENRDKYTETQFRTELNNIIKNDTITDEIMQTQIQYYKKVLDNANFKEAIEKRNSDTENKIKFNLEELKLTNEQGQSLFSGAELTSIISMFDKINSLYKHGNITENSGQAFLNQYITLWNESNEAKQAILSSITDFSEEGLKNINQLIDDSTDMTNQEKSSLKTSIAALFGLIPQNLNTALKSYEDKMSEATESYGKDISTATKGMDYKTAVEMAQKLDIAPTEEYFDIRDGELFLKNTQLIYDHYFGKNGISSTLSDQLTETSAKMIIYIDQLKKLSQLENIQQSDLDDKGIDIDLNTVKAFLKDAKDKEITEDFIVQYFQGKIASAQQVVDTLLGSDELNRAIDSGKLLDIAKASTASKTTSTSSAQQLLDKYILPAIQSGDFTKILGEAGFSNEFKAKLPGLKQTYDDAQSSVIDDLINGINESFAIIEGNEFNQELLTNLQSKGLVQLTESINGVSNAIVTASSESVLAYLTTVSNTSRLGMTSSQLNEKIMSLRKDVYEKSQDGVLQTVLKNYDNLDEIAYKNFRERYIIDDATATAIFGAQRADGSYKVNLTNFSNALKNSELKIDELTQEMINDVMTKAIDDRTKLITDTTSYVTKGTNNQQDINKFKVAAQSLGMTISESAFSYDSILNAWTLDPAVLTEYAQKQAQELIDAGLLQQNELTDYLDVNVRQTLAQQINISDFLKAENKGVTGKAYQTLKTSLVNYLNSSDELLNKLRDDYIESQVNKAPKMKQEELRSTLQSLTTAETIANLYINQIKQGGTQAIEVARAIADAQGQELSAEDIEAVYRAEISEVENALDQILYGPGSLVSGRAVKILQALEKEGKASITTLGDGSSAVINSITDIAAAYEAYYNELAATGEATLAALNEAKAKVLETKNGRAEEQSAINALGDASGMTYSAFAEVFTNAGIELTDDLMQQLETDQIIEAMGGNKMRIKDFAKFAQAMNWDFDSEEYISAFKTYNDSLIDLNNKVSRNIVEEVTKLKDAKPGDWINLTEFSHALNDTVLNNLNQVLYQYGAYIQDGILKLTDNANLLEVSQAIQQAALNAQLDLKNGFNEIADAIQDVLKSYVEAIQNGINGGLSNVDAANLQQKAVDLGVNNINFIKTAEGLKLSEQSAIALYSALKKVDAMQASLVFNDLKESIESTNENFQSTSSILGYINGLNQQINAADSNVTNARLQQYEAELSVAKEILAVRMTSEDSSMNFMSNALPAAQQNPLNYYKNWSQAFSALKNAKREKAYSHKDNKWHRDLIDYQDWYNIVNEMSNIAAASGELITLGKDIEGNALVLDGSLEKASELIQKGADSLVQADTGELKVSLRDMGVNFEAGSGAMSTGIEAGIRNIADSQVHMLDGIIRVLEMIVAMEQLGDVTGEDMSIDLGDIFAVDGQDATEETISSINDFTEKFKKSRENLLNTIAGTDTEEAFKHTHVSLLGQQYSMLDLFSKDFTELFPQGDNIPQSARESAMKAYQGMLDSFYKAAISGDYDINNIAESVQNIMKQNGIDLSNFVFEFTDENNKVTRMLKFVGETLIDIDFEDKDTRTNFDKYFGTKYANDEDGYREHIQELLEEYQTKEENGTLTREESIKIRTELGVASNEFVLKKNKDNSFTGYYNGKEFTGSNAQDLLQLMAQAALLKDQGFDFNTEVIVDKATGQKSTVLKGTTTIGGIEVGVKLNKNGKPIYTYVDKNGHPHNSQDPKELMGYMAADGKLEELDVGTYSFEKGGKKYNIEVKEHSTLNLKYTITTDPTGQTIYTFNGQDFDDYNAMYEYMTTVDEYDPLGTKSNIVVNKDGTKTNTITVNEKLGAKVIINYDSNGIKGPPQYSIGGKPIPGDNAKAVFDSIMAVIEKNGGEFDTNQDYSGKELQAAYYYLNQKVNVQIDCETGETTYSWQDEDGNTVTGNDPALVEAAIAAKKGLNDSSPKTAEATINIDKEVKVTFRLVDGKIEVGPATDKDGNPTELTEEQQKKAQEMAEKLQEQLNNNPQTVENPIEAAASSIIIKTEGATVTTDVETIALSSPINEATGTITNLKVKTDNVDAEGNIQGVKVTGVIDGTIDYKKGEVEKPTEEETTTTGNIDWTNNVTIPENLQAIGTIHWKNDITKPGDATGTVGLAKAGGTLMGELGPELVVSNGKYFVAGQNGAEFVNLDSDAIVFNHLQTKSLFENGMSKTRGRAVTNERNAVAFARGNVAGGPAMSSASAALAALKQLRAQWASLANLSAQDLAGAGGGGGGGGGKDAAFIKELERWYNYLQKIAQLEKEINFEEAKRNRIKSQSNRSGSDYYKSQKESLKDLKEESETYRKLAAEQQAYFDKRREEMNKKSNPFTSLYTFDENGQLKYKPGALEKLSKISGRDNTGKPNKTPKQQYDAIVKMNPKFKEFMKHDSSGNKIEYKNGKPKDDAAYVAAIQAFWDKIEADRQENQSLHDSIEDAKLKQEELDTKRNELLQEMKDNQMSVEDKVLKAIEDQRQRAIDKLSDERNALEKSTGKYIQGLSDALSKEREMYEKSDSADELNRLMRQLDILKRSGGSASEIRDIEGQIREKQRDAYFDAQQEQIDKVQEASDLQLERLDTQIEIMTEALEYQKQMGLLWDEVYQVMSGSAEDITAFIMGNTTEFWEKSPLALEQEAQQTFFEADQWQAYRDDLDVIAEGQGTDTPTANEGSGDSGGSGGSSNDDKQAASRKKYKVTYTDKKGKEKTKTFNTKEEADTYKKSIEKDKKNKKGTKVTVSTLSYYVYAFKKGWKKGDSAKEFGPYTKADANKKKTSLESNASYAYKTTKKKIKVAKNRPKGYSEGGYDYDTGLAMLHGTPAKPEAVLNAAQTKVLRDNILSKKPNSLLSLLEAYNEAYKDGIGTITNNEGITIENATVNMNVQQIANDYDAQRAGEQALAEMLRIARKTSAANSVRR